jgi:hypothetical protein
MEVGRNWWHAVLKGKENRGSYQSIQENQSLLTCAFVVYPRLPYLAGVFD